MIPPHLPVRFRGGMERYLHDGILPGGFLRAVLCNDLKEALSRADDRSVMELPGIVSWLYSTAPMDCWGSPEAMNNWAASFAVANQEGG